MDLSVNDLRLMRRAIKFSVAHLNEASAQARITGHVHESVSCMVEAEKLSNLSEQLHEQLINRLKTAKLAEIVVRGTSVAPGEPTRDSGSGPCTDWECCDCPKCLSFSDGHDGR